MAQLKKGISFTGLVSLGAAGVIGSSWIYTNSKFFAKYGAGGEIFGLAAATVIAIFVALSYAELATIFPRAGGEVVYTFVAYGSKVSFVAAWALIGAYLSSLAFYVTASSLLLSKLFPQLATGPFYTIAGVDVHLPEIAFGVAITILVFLFNYYGASLASGIQQIMFAGMIIVGAALVFAGFGHGSLANFWPAWDPGMDPMMSVLRFILPAMTFLTGFELVAVLAEEANMSARKIGISVIMSIVLAGAFYVIVLLSSAWVIPWQETAKFSMGTIDAFTAAGFPLLGYGAFAISVLGLLTSFLGLFAATPRLILSLARSNMLPKAFVKTHPKYATPTNALWLTLAFTLGFGWLGKGALVWFLDMGGFTVAIAWVLTVVSLFKIRSKYPDLKGAYRVSTLALPFIGGLAAIAVAAGTLFPGTTISLEWPYEYAMLVVWTVAGFVLYKMAPKGDDENNLKELLGEYYDLLQPKVGK